MHVDGILKDAENNNLTNETSLNKELNQEKGYSILEWLYNDNLGIILENSKINIQENKIKLSQGSIYLDIKNKTQICLKNQYCFNIENVSGLYNAEDQTFTVLSGEIDILDQANKAKTNQIIYVKNDKLEIKNLDRKILVQAESWKNLLAILENNAKYVELPKILTDTNAPEIKDINPTTETETEEEKIEITGTTELNSILKINDQEVKLDANGKFKDSISLNLGENKIIIKSIDEYGNYTTKEIKIIRKEKPKVIEESEANESQNNSSSAQTNTNESKPEQKESSCSDGGFNTQLVCLINEHRANNGKNALTPTTLDHSKYMASQGKLSHDNFAERCASKCDAENAAFASSPTAQRIFDQWKTSSIHNQNMLGSHTQIGTALYSGFATAVFN